MKQVLYLLFFCISFQSQAQNWVNCTSGHFVNDLHFHNGILWSATTGGLVKDDLSGNTPQFFNRGNSPIPSNTVKSLEIDADENLWLSTNRGTAVFDGNDWQLFYDKNGLLQLDNNGKMVIATTDSLHWWDGQSFESMDVPNGSFFSITGFEIDPSTGDIWTTYYGFGQYAVYKYDGSEFTIYTAQNSNLPFESAAHNPLVIDSDNRVLVGTSSGLFRFENDSWILLSDVIQDFPAGATIGLGSDELGNIWVSLISAWPEEDGYLIKINADDEIESFPFPSFFSSYPIIQTFEVIYEPTPAIFVGTPRFGLWKFDLNDWNQIQTDQSPAQTNHITQIFVDGSRTYLQLGNNLTNDQNAIFSITEGDWLYYNSDNLPFAFNQNYTPTVVTKGPNDTLWMHTGDSLFAFINDEWYFPSFPDILNDVEEINSFIHFEPDGKRWLLERWQSYIFHETDQGWDVFEKEEHGVSSGAYNSYFTHPQTGDFWIASPNGISRYDGQDWTTFHPQDFGWGPNQFSNMEVDANGVVWANTYKTIFRIENNIPEVFAEEIPGLPNAIFYGLTLDDDGGLWIGLGGALAYHNGSDWQIFDNTNSGIPNGLIRELKFDDLDNLWIGSLNGGFAVYNPNGLPDFLLDDFHTSLLDSSPDNPVASIAVFPNPVFKNSVLNIEIPSSFTINKKTSFLFYNELGQVVHEGQISSHSQQLSLNSLAVSGTYFLKIWNGEKSLIGKIVVLK